MKHNALPVQATAQARSFHPVALMVLTMGAMLVSVGALNGGTALAASAWDTLQTTIQTMLGSTLVLALVLLSLIVTIWQLSHGQGYRNLTVVLGILATALIGPSLVQTVATATGTPAHVASAQFDVDLAH
jgi:fumarate reductase subunit D